MNNFDQETIASFGDEWSRFDQSGMNDGESRKVFNEYFSIFPMGSLSPDAEGFDMGCGSGRWARWMAPRVGRLHCIDPSCAIDVAKRNLSDHSNVSFHRASVDAKCLPAGSQDFGYSLGVLHHVPDTAAAIRSCVEFLKPGAPLLLYLYYAFDNRAWWFRSVWTISDWCRRVICQMPPKLKHLLTDVIAVMVYFPLSKLSLLADRLKIGADSLPLYYYRHHSFYTMRTDARDRFGTPLERRFTQQQITKMMEVAGLDNIQFSSGPPYWCAVGFKVA